MEEDLTGYSCTKEIRQEIRQEISITIRESNNYIKAPVIKLSENCYAVYGRPTASNPLGFCHVQQKVDDGHFVCSGKDCHGIMSKAKQTRVKAICPHLHMLKCALKLRSDKDVTKQEEQDVRSPVTVSVDVIPDVVADEQLGNESISRRSSVRLALFRKIPYNVSKDVLERISKKGKSYLLTELNSFKTIVIKVKVCQNKECKAMHQSLPYDIGK